MKIVIIAAMAQNRVIGRNNKLPWHIPEELAIFKEVTMGCPMIMGRKTFESLPGLLPGREHIVLSSNTEYEPKGAVHAFSIEDALDYCKTYNHDVVYVIGGAKIFEESFPIATHIRLTLLHREVAGDVYLPPIPMENFKVVDSHEYNDTSEKFSIVVYERAAKGD